MSAPQGPRPGDRSDAAEPGTMPPGPSQGSPAPESLDRQRPGQGSPTPESRVSEPHGETGRAADRGTTADTGHTGPGSGAPSAPGPITEADDLTDGSETGTGSGPREHTPRINPARMEVRVRRIALLGLVLVPLIYFIVQSLR